MILSISGIRKSFSGIEVLKGIDLSVEEGDVVAILGPSGSGKTTLLRCMNLLETPDEGKLTFLSKTRAHREKRARRATKTHAHC